MQALEDVVHSRFLPNAVVIHHDPSAPAESMAILPEVSQWQARRERWHCGLNNTALLRNTHTDCAQIRPHQRAGHRLRLPEPGVLPSHHGRASPGGALGSQGGRRRGAIAGREAERRRTRCRILV